MEIRKRFAPDIIERLLRLKWWDWDMDKSPGMFNI